ncbi:MAG: hypothetical protein DPW16_22050 [Chloroflexi bacterium]|nr:hypothetical protein [Chloroflexota bacterium]
MPSQALTSGELTAFRSEGQFSNAWLSVAPSTTVGTARVNQTTFTNPVTQLTVDNTSVDWLTYVRKGMTVWIGTTAGARDIGVYRVRENPTATVLPIAEMSSGDPGLLALPTLRPLANDAYITIVQDYNLWSIFPRISGGVFTKDYDDAYTDQNELGGEIPGYILMGNHRRGRMSGSSISFDFEADPQWFEVIGTADCDWAFQNGTPSTATGVGPHTVSFPAGVHEVACVAVSDNGGQASATRWVFAHDFASNPPYSVKVLSGRTTKQGRRLSLEVIGADLNDTALQAGTMVMLWEELYFEGGATLDSACTQLVGWIESVSGGGDSGVPVYRVEVMQALHRLEQIRGFSQVLTATANPTNWQEVSPTLCHFNFYLFYLLYWHTSLLQLFDYDAQSFVEVTMNTWANDPGDWYTTINRLGSFVSAELGQASDGTLYLRRQPSLMNNTERNLLTERVTLSVSSTTCDLLVIPDMERRQFPEVGQTQGFAFQYNVITGQRTGLKSYAPGEVPGQGGRTEQMPDQWVAHPDHLDLLTANYHAMVNNPYPRIPIQLTRSNAVNALLTAPAEMYWVELDVDADHWPEGVAYAARCVVEDISIQWNEDGTKDAALNLVPETNGNYAPGQAMPTTLDNETDPTTVQFPSIDDITGTIEIPYDNLLGLPPVSTPLVTEEEQISGVLFAWSPNAVGVAYNPAVPSFLPFWYPPAGEAIMSLAFDRRSPRFTTDRRRGALRGWILTDDSLYSVANFLAAAPEVTQRQNPFVGFNLLREVGGVSTGVGVFGVAASTVSGDVVLTFDSSSDPAYTVNQGTVGAGGRTGDGLHSVSDGSNIVANIRIDLGESTTLQAFEFWINVVFDGSDDEISVNVTGYQSNGSTQTGTTGNNQRTVTPSTWSQLTFSSLNWANTRYVQINMQNPNYVLDTFVADDFTADTTISGVAAGVWYSANDGATGTAVTVGGSPTQGGYDPDHYNLGYHVATTGEALRHTTTYTGSMTTITGITAASGGVEFNLVRVPYRVLTSTASNNSPGALHVIWGANGLVSGATLWRGVLDGPNHSMGSITDITPVVSGVTYRPVGPESLETYAGDSRVMLLIGVPVAGGSPVRLHSSDAGDNWASGGPADFDFVRWTGRTRAWLAGDDGIGFTPDRGISLEDRDGDYELQLEAFPLIGVEAV